MRSPADFDRDPASVEKRILRKFEAAETEQRIVGLITDTYEAILAEELIILSRAERKRLLARATRTLLESVQKRLDAA